VLKCEDYNIPESNRTKCIVGLCHRQITRTSQQMQSTASDESLSKLATSYCSWTHAIHHNGESAVKQILQKNLTKPA